MTTFDGFITRITCSSTTAPKGSSGRRLRETTSIESMRIDLAAGDHVAEVGGLSRVDCVVVHDVERIAGLADMQAGERAPGAADGVEGALFADGQHLRSFQRVGGDLLGLLGRAVRGLLQPDAAEREGLAGAGGVAADIDHVDAAAAEVAGDAVRLVEAGDDPLRAQPGFLAAREHRRLGAGDRLDRSDEVRTVGGVADGGGGQHVQGRDAELLDQRGEAANGGQRRGDCRRLEPAARRQAATEAAQLLLVKERRGGAGEPLVDDQADGVGADVDDRNRPAAVETPGRARDDGQCVIQNYAPRPRRRPGGLGAIFTALPRPDRLGLVMKYWCALMRTSPFLGTTRCAEPSGITRQLC